MGAIIILVLKRIIIIYRRFVLAVKIHSTRAAFGELQGHPQARRESIDKSEKIIIKFL